MKALVAAVVCLILVPDSVRTTPEPGLWNVDITKDHSQAMFSKSLYEGSTIKVKMVCTAPDKQRGENKLKISIRYAGRMTQCQGEFNEIDDPAQQDLADRYITAAAEQVINGERVMYFVDESQQLYDCDGSDIILKDHGSLDWITVLANDTTPAESEKTPGEEQLVDAVTPPVLVTAKTIDTKKAAKTNKAKPKKPVTVGDVDESRRKRAVSKSEEGQDSKLLKVRTRLDKVNSEDTVTVTTAAAAGAVSTNNGLHQIAVTKEDGIYLFAFVFECAYYNTKTNRIDPSNSDCDFNLALTVEMHHERFGYLSAIDWPQLPFYATMCAVYSLYTLAWITLCICFWRDLIRLQFWIAGVILLGLIEKSIFLAEYQSVFFSGLSVLPGAVVIAEIVSALKRTLARILIVIVSVGFGIVRPRLGPIFNRVLMIGGFYFVCASVEGCLRQLHPKGDNSWLLLLSVFPLALIDAILCCWIFTSLVHTIRQLRVRRNVAKLALYKHFTNVLIFAVLASLVYMVWSAVEHKLAKCIIDWKELWMDEAFWQMLFSTILLVIIILFRPSNNAVKYAFQPLLDADEEGEEGSEQDEVVMTNLADDVKKKQRSSDKEKERENGKTHSNPKSAKENDDLKWVEENIPVTEGVLPSLLDSDEEIMASKFERNKME